MFRNNKKEDWFSSKMYTLDILKEKSIYSKD